MSGIRDWKVCAMRAGRMPFNRRAFLRDAEHYWTALGLQQKQLTAYGAGAVAR